MDFPHASRIALGQVRPAGQRQPPAAGGPGDSGRGTSPAAVPTSSSGGTGFDSARPGAMPGTADAGSPTGTEAPCQEDLLAAATALDRSAFTAEAATAASARAKGGGSTLPRFSARRSIPAQAVGLK